MEGWRAGREGEAEDKRMERWGEKKETRRGERAARHLNDQPVIAKGFFSPPFITSKGMPRDKKWDRIAPYLSPLLSKQL